MVIFIEDATNIIDYYEVSIVEQESSIQKLKFSKVQKEYHFRKGTWFKAALPFDQHRNS